MHHIRDERKLEHKKSVIIKHEGNLLKIAANKLLRNMLKDNIAVDKIEIIIQKFNVKLRACTVSISD